MRKLSMVGQSLTQSHRFTLAGGDIIGIYRVQEQEAEIRVVLRRGAEEMRH